MRGSPKHHKPRSAVPMSWTPGSARPYKGPRATGVRVVRRQLIVTLDDSRVLIVPLEMLPGLDAAPASARKVHELLGGGIGIRFPLCDEDVSVANLLRPEMVMHHQRPTRVQAKRERARKAKP